MSEAWTIGKVVRWATDDFRQRGIESARLDAEVLLAFALGVDRMRIFVDAERPLSPGELSRYRELIRRRRAREPVAYLRGYREFYGRSFRVDARVLIPRPDTEALVDVALRRTRARDMHGRALDLCTGSGCVAITFARERPTWTVDATDLSTDALALARENALRLGVVGNFSLRGGDLFAPLGEGSRAYDLVTANPPYIPDAELATLDADVRDFEPRMALSGGADGFTITRRIVAEAPRHLVPGGVLAVELMAGQAPVGVELFSAAGFVEVEIARDYGGHERVVSGRTPA